MDKTKLGKLNKLIDIMDEGVSKEEFLANFKIVLDIVKKFKNRVDTAIITLTSQFNEQADRLSAENKEEFIKLKNQFNSLSKQLTDKVSNLKNGQDGQNADEEKIVDKVLSKIKIPTIDELKKELPIMAVEVRDALELLTGDERLEISSIKSLKEELEELRKMKGQGLGGGGFSKLAMDFHIIDEEVPTGAINGVNTDFVLAHMPAPTASLKVYLTGQKMKLTTDYTLSSKTITFLTAPLATDNITCDYRI
mgnify:FL=1